MAGASSSRPSMKIAVLGHSYVNRLDFVSPLNLPWCVLRKFGAPGATVSSIKHSSAWENCIHYRPDVILLVLGGNDIKFNTSPRKLSREIISLALELEEAIHCQCHIFSIEPRLKPRGLTSDHYNTIKNAVNRGLGRHPNSKSRFHGIGVAQEDLGSDGVHLSLEGNKKLFRRIVEVGQMLVDKDE